MFKSTICQEQRMMNTLLCQITTIYVHRRGTVQYWKPRTIFAYDKWIISMVPYILQTNILNYWYKNYAEASCNIHMRWEARESTGTATGYSLLIKQVEQSHGYGIDWDTQISPFNVYNFNLKTYLWNNQYGYKNLLLFILFR